eukprot:COSAG06_NODE_28_length_32009_cov_31.553463_23_plen_116_part_00
MILVKKLPSWAQSPRCSHQFSQREVAALLASATTLQTPPLAPLGMAESSSSRSMALRTVVLLAWAIAFDRARALEAGGGHASFHVDLSAVCGLTALVSLLYKGRVGGPYWPCLAR